MSGYLDMSERGYLHARFHVAAKIQTHMNPETFPGGLVSCLALQHCRVLNSRLNRSATTFIRRNRDARRCPLLQLGGLEWLRSFLVLIVLAGPAAELFAGDYFVSVTGSDSAAGTQAAPWRTMSKVYSASLQPGDNVFLKGGETFTGPLVVNWSGSSSAPITISSYGTGKAVIQATNTDQRAIYLGNFSYLTFNNLNLSGPGNATSTRAGFESWMTSRQHGITLTGIDVSGFQNGIMIGSWASGTGIDGLLVDRCRAFDNKNQGIWSYGATVTDHANFVIRRSIACGNIGTAASNQTGSGICINGVTGCLIEKCAAFRNGNPGGGGIGIWFYGVSNGTIQYCESYDNLAPINSDGGGFDLDGGVANSRIQYCYSHNNDGAGYLLWQYGGSTADYQANDGNVVRYNISMNDGRRRGYGGITAGGSSPTDNIRNAHIYNNTIYTATTTTDAADPACVAIDGEKCSGVKLWNNIFIAGNGRSLVKTWSTTSTAQALFQNNIYHVMPGTSFSIKWNGGAHASLSNWRGTGQEKNGSVLMGLQADPLLASPAASPVLATTLADCETLDLKIKALMNFTPAAASPVIDSALDLTSSTWGSLDVGPHDLLGASLPQGAGYDMGAVEFSSAIAYAIWAGPSGYNLSGGPDDDDDGDGLSNFHEFAFGTNPTVADVAIPATMSRANDSLIVRYQRNVGSRLNYSLWTSSDLHVWNGPRATSQERVAGSLGDETELMEITVPDSSTAPRLFLRVKAE